uniref:all-trans-retinol 13,14-reductase isoform X1 n=1 Tax=Myxine glutinosa TaxID=7769 RepID=UPI00358FEBBE
MYVLLAALGLGGTGLGLWIVLRVVTRWMHPKQGKNPFRASSLRVPGPLVMDSAVRKRVIKRAFSASFVPENLDAIVIGSGIGGLSVAALLAKAGKRVLVLEQHSKAGGCCHTYGKKGFEFDVGIHYVGEMQSNAITRLLIDQLTDGQLQWIPLDDPFDTVFLGEPGEIRRRCPLFAGRYHYWEGLKAEFPKEHEALGKFQDLLQETRRGTLFLVLLKVLPLWFARLLARTGLIHLFTSYFRLAARSLSSVLEELTSDVDLRAVLSYCCFDYGCFPKDTSFTMHAILLNHYQYGSFYPVGGASEIAFHIIPVIERAGGAVLTRALVKRVLLDSAGKACGVTVQKPSGEVYINAPLVISDAGIFNTFQSLLPQDARINSKINAILGRVDHSMASFSVFVGLRGTQEELGLRAANFWLVRDSDIDHSVSRYMSLSQNDAIKENPPVLFISFPSAKDPSWDQRHPGVSTMAVVSISRNDWFSEWSSGKVRKRGDEYEALKGAFGQLILDQVIKIFPHLEDKIEYVEYATPASNQHYLCSPCGEIYGANHNMNRFTPDTAALLRPQTPIQNLYLTGQDVFCCGFAGAMFGGLLCASQILNRNLYDDLQKFKKQTPMEATLKVQ